MASGKLTIRLIPTVTLGLGVMMVAGCASQSSAPPASQESARKLPVIDLDE